MSEPIKTIMYASGSARENKSNSNMFADFVLLVLMRVMPSCCYTEARTGYQQVNVEVRSLLATAR